MAQEPLHEQNRKLFSCFFTKCLRCAGSVQSGYCSQLQSSVWNGRQNSCPEDEYAAEIGESDDCKCPGGSPVWGMGSTGSLLFQGGSPASGEQSLMLGELPQGRQFQSREGRRPCSQRKMTQRKEIIGLGLDR